MKTKIIIFTLGFCLFGLYGNAQIDSVSFYKSDIAEIKTVNVEEISINKMKINTNEGQTQYLSLGTECNYLLPKYSELTEGVTNFKKIKSNAETSISALGSSLSVERKSEFYVYYFTRSKTFICSQNYINNRVSYGVGVFVILKISSLKTKLDIRTPYDIAAIGQLGLAKIEIEIKHFGMTPNLADEFLPNELGKIDIEAAKYFDKLLKNSKTKINDTNTIPTLLPIEF